MQSSKTKTFFLFFWIILFLSPSSSGFALSVKDVPNPQVTARSYVQDSGGMLGSEYSALIDQISKELERKTSAELAVVTIDNLDGLTVEDYAFQLFNEWGIGKKAKDNGILILVARDDRRFRIEVGYGLEGALPDAIAKRLIEQVAVPLYKQGQFGKGTYLLTRRVAEIIAKAQGVNITSLLPTHFPTQVELPSQETNSAQKLPFKFVWPEHFFSTPYSYFVWALGVTLVWFSFKSVRFELSQSRAGKRKIAGADSAMHFGIFLFIAGGIIALTWNTWMITNGWITAFSYAGGSVFGSFLGGRWRKIFEKRINRFQRVCSQCHQKMNFISEKKDDQFLSAEECAEEQAEGMDYEFWECPSCKKRDRLEIKLGKAKNCSQCKRRTLKKTTEVLVQPTRSFSGQKLVEENCKNPKCNYHRQWYVTIPKLSSSSSRSGSSSGGGSFGGGSSGGGGASGSW